MFFLQIVVGMHHQSALLHQLRPHSKIIGLHQIRLQLCLLEQGCGLFIQLLGHMILNGGSVCENKLLHGLHLGSKILLIGHKVELHRQRVAGVQIGQQLFERDLDAGVARVNRSEEIALLAVLPRDMEKHGMDGILIRLQRVGRLCGRSNALLRCTLRRCRGVGLTGCKQGQKQDEHKKQGQLFHKTSNLTGNRAECAAGGAAMQAACFWVDRSQCRNCG